MSDYKSWVYSVLLVLAVSMVYGQFLHNPVLFDDLFFLSSLLQPHTELNELRPWMVRWLPYFTLLTAAEGLDSEVIVPIRVVSLLLHASVGITLFFFLRRLFRLVLARNGLPEKSLSFDLTAFFSALFFVLHPVSVYGAAYMVQRTIVMATLFSLLALVSYMRGLETGRRMWLWASVVLYFMAVMSKEHAIMLPAVMLALTVLLVRPDAGMVRRLWPVYVGFFAVALYVVIQKIGLLGEVYEPSGEHMIEAIGSHSPFLMSVITQAWLFFKYLALWLLPNPAWMSADMREPFALSLWSAYSLAMAAFLGYGLVAIRLLWMQGKAGLIGFAMLFPWLMFMTEFSAVRIQEPFVLYRSYLWMPGLFILLPLCIQKLNPKVAFWGLLVIAICLSLGAVNRLGTFSHSLLLWDDAEALVHDRRDLPGVDRIYGNRAKYLLDIKRYQQAVDDYEVAIKLRPDVATHHHGLAATYLPMGEYEKAIAEFSRSIELEPLRSSAWHGRGLAYRALGKNLFALHDFQKGCELGRRVACQDFELMQTQVPPR